MDQISAAELFKELESGQLILEPDDYNFGDIVQVSFEEENLEQNIEQTLTVSNDKKCWNDDVKNFITNKLDKANTIRCTNRDIRQFQTYLETQFVLCPIEELSPTDLNHHLANFFMSCMKKDGSSYEPSSLTAKLYSIDRYLQANDYPHSLRSDKAFKLTRDSLKAKKVASKEDGKGNRPHKAAGLSKEDEEVLRKTGVLSDNTPFSLQFSIW